MKFSLSRRLTEKVLLPYLFHCAAFAISRKREEELSDQGCKKYEVICLQRTVVEFCLLFEIDILQKL